MISDDLQIWEYGESGFRLDCLMHFDSPMMIMAVPLLSMTLDRIWDPNGS